MGSGILILEHSWL